MPIIAMSYRRSDSQDITGRIFDRLAGHFGSASVFRDIDNIRPGLDFREQIADALSRTNVLLAVVGPNWFGFAGGVEPRISDEGDFVRIEIETALKRSIPVIPILVSGAKMPSPAQLPESLQSFSFRHALTVDSGQDFDHHMSRLIRSIDRLVAESANRNPANEKLDDPFANPKSGLRKIAASRWTYLAAIVFFGAGSWLAWPSVNNWLHQYRSENSERSKTPPTVEITYPMNNARFSAENIAISYRFGPDSNVDRLEILVDGKPIKAITPARPRSDSSVTARDGSMFQSQGATAKNEGSVTQSEGSITVKLPLRDLQLSLIAWNGELVSEAAEIRLKYSKPRLFGFIVGVSDYFNPRLAQQYGAKDARDFAAILQNNLKSYFSDVQVQIMTDHEATRASMMGGLEWLESQVNEPGDVSVIFFSGHGMIEEKSQTFWFMPSEADPEKIRTTAVSQDDFRRTLRALPGKVLLVLDTGVRLSDIEQILVKDFTAPEIGTVVMVSCAKKETSVNFGSAQTSDFVVKIVKDIRDTKQRLYTRNCAANRPQ